MSENNERASRSAEWFDELKAEVDAYVMHGADPGDFLTAVIENDLEGVLDLPLEEDIRPLLTPSESRPPLQSVLEIMHYIRGNVPEHAQGQHDAVINWMKLSAAAREKEKVVSRGLNILSMTMPAFPQHDVGDTFGRLPREQKAMVAARAIRDIHAVVSGCGIMVQVAHELEDVRGEVSQAVKESERPF